MRPGLKVRSCAGGCLRKVAFSSLSQCASRSNQLPRGCSAVARAYGAPCDGAPEGAQLVRKCVCACGAKL